MEINKNYDDSSLEFYAHVTVCGGRREHRKDDDGEQQDNVVMKSTKPIFTRNVNDDGAAFRGGSN